MGIRIEKDPWWVRHETIGYIYGAFIIFFALFFMVILVIIEQIWMNCKGYGFDPVQGRYIHQKRDEKL